MIRKKKEADSCCLSEKIKSNGILVDLIHGEFAQSKCSETDQNQTIMDRASEIVDECETSRVSATLALLFQRWFVTSAQYCYMETALGSLQFSLGKDKDCALCSS